MSAKSHAQNSQDSPRIEKRGLAAVLREILQRIRELELLGCLRRKRAHFPSNQPHPECTPSPTESQDRLLDDTVVPPDTHTQPQISEPANPTMRRANLSRPAIAVSEVCTLPGPEPTGSEQVAVAGDEETVCIHPPSADMPGPNAGSVSVDMTSKQSVQTSAGVVEYGDEGDVIVDSEDETQRENWTTAMQIHSPNDPDGLKTQHCLALIDSGSSCCITSRKVIKEMGAEGNMYSETHKIKTLQKEELIITGVIVLKFNIRKYPGRVYYTKFFVLDEGETDFDFLLGRNWISRCPGGIIRDFEKIPTVHFFAASRHQLSELPDV